MTHPSGERNIASRPLIGYLGMSRLQATFKPPSSRRSATVKPPSAAFGRLSERPRRRQAPLSSMHALLDRFNFQSARWPSGVSLIIFLIWMTVVACIISSILTQPFGPRQRIFWITVVVLLPGVGVLAYLPFAFRKEELPPIFQHRAKRSKRPGKVPMDPDA
jgi:hypothetical protein